MDYKQTLEQNKEAKKKMHENTENYYKANTLANTTTRCLKTRLCHTVSYGRVNNRVVLGEKQMQKSLLSSAQGK